MTSVCPPATDPGRSSLQDISGQCSAILAQLGLIEAAQTKAASKNAQFSAIITKISRLLRYLQAVNDICQVRTDKKRFCIKYKDLNLAFLRRLDSKSICWKYLLCLSQHLLLTLQKEFEQPLKWFEYYGDIEFTDVFSSKMPLLVSFC